MSFFSDIRSSMQKRAKFYATVRELESLDAHTARDLNIQRSDIRRIAHHAIYTHNVSQNS